MPAITLIQSSPIRATATGPTLNSRSRGDQLAAEAARLRRAESVFNETAATLGVGAAAASAFGGLAGRTAGTLLGIGAGVAAYQGNQIGKQAAEVEKQAEQAKSEEAKQPDASPPAAAPAPTSPSAPAPAPQSGKKKSGRDDGGRMDLPRGDSSHGGRASEERPDRRDMISRTC